MDGVVGLDIGSDTVTVAVLAADGQELGRRWEIANSEAGATALCRRLTQLAAEHGIRRWQIGLEASSLYWWPLAVRLSTETALPGVEVFALNPKRVKDFRPLLGNLPKTDRHDAGVIAEQVRFGRGLPAPFAVDWRYAPLQRLTRFRMHVASTLVREKNYFLSMLFLPFSGFVQAHAFADPFGASSLAILESYTTEELVRTPVEELAATLERTGRKHFRDPTATATVLQQAAKDSYRLQPALADPLRLVLGTTRTTITTLQRQLAELDRTIARELTGIPQTLSSTPGLGPVWTAALVAEIGDIRRFPDEAALAQYAGLTWTVHESGHFQAEDTVLTKRGNPYLRYALIEAANSVRIHCPEYTTYYQAKYAESPKHAHKRALVLTARKLVRLVDALLRTDTIYQPLENRKTRKELTRPHPARPAKHHRTRPVPATR
jgi:transposase